LLTLVTRSNFGEHHTAIMSLIGLLGHRRTDECGLCVMRYVLTWKRTRVFRHQQKHSQAITQFSIAV